MKIVVYTQRVKVIESYNERRDCADQRIPEFIQACGYLPVPMPNNVNVALQMVDELGVAGIILTGGNSLVQYGGNAPERDSTDSALIKRAIEKQIPLYGFCRGMQSILDYCGESLENVKGHVATRHQIQALTDLPHGNFNREVNTYHNQACLKIVGNDLIALAKSSDGVIEAIHHRTLPILGTMWHPERESSFSKEDIDMLVRLIDPSIA